MNLTRPKIQLLSSVKGEEDFVRTREERLTALIELIMKGEGRSQDLQYIPNYCDLVPLQSSHS